MTTTGQIAALEGQIAALEERIKVLELGMAYRKSAINLLINESRVNRGLEPYDFDAAEEHMP